MFGHMTVLALRQAMAKQLSVDLSVIQLGLTTKDGDADVVAYLPLSMDNVSTQTIVEHTKNSQFKLRILEISSKLMDTTIQRGNMLLASSTTSNSKLQNSQNLTSSAIIFSQVVYQHPYEENTKFVVFVSSKMMIAQFLENVAWDHVEFQTSPSRIIIKRTTTPVTVLPTQYPKISFNDPIVLLDLIIGKKKQ